MYGKYRVINVTQLAAYDKAIVPIRGRISAEYRKDKKLRGRMISYLSFFLFFI
jgi:hypothetical protein